MGESSEEQMLHAPCLITQYDNYTKAREDSWEIVKGHDNGDDDDTGYVYDTTSSTSVSDRSTSSLELVDDTASSRSSSCSSSLLSHGSLFHLSDLMAQLPVKRGLSKYFEGKSQSFTSLSKVKSVEDLAQKESPYNQRKALKESKSYGGGLGSYRAYTLPKATISKIKTSSASRASYLSSNNLSLSSRTRGSSFGSNTLPPIPVRKKF